MKQWSYPARHFYRDRVLDFCFWLPASFFIPVDVRIQRVSHFFLLASSGAINATICFIQKNRPGVTCICAANWCELIRTSVRCREEGCNYYCAVIQGPPRRTVNQNLCPPLASCLDGVLLSGISPDCTEVTIVHPSTMDSWMRKENESIPSSRWWMRSHSSHPRVWSRFVLPYFSSYQLTTFYFFRKSSEISRTAKFVFSPLVQALDSVRVLMILFFLHSPCSHSLSSPTSSV